MERVQETMDARQKEQYVQKSRADNIFLLLLYLIKIFFKNLKYRNFPGGPVVKNPPSNAGDVGSIPGQGTKIPHASGQLSPHALEPACHN